MAKDQQVRNRKSLQFHISHLLWLIVVAAIGCALSRAELWPVVGALGALLGGLVLSWVAIGLPLLGIHLALVWCCRTDESAYWVGRTLLRSGFAVAVIGSTLIAASVFGLLSR